jgi:large-conductance mechanosensitive channel
MRKSLSNLWAEFRAFAFKGNMIDLAVAVVIGAAFSGVIDSLVKDVIMPTISYATTAVKDAKNAAADVAAKATPAVGITTQPATEPAASSTVPSAVPATGPATPEAVAVARAAAATQPATGPADPEKPRSADQVADSMIAAAAGGKSKEWQEMTSAFATALAADRKAADEKAAADKAVADKKAADEKTVDFSWKVGRINIGNFLAAILNFMIIAAAVFIIIVKLLGGVMKRAGGGTPKPGEPTTKECPECLSVIAIKARRCPSCTAVLVPVTAAETRTSPTA